VVLIADLDLSRVGNSGHGVSSALLRFCGRYMQLPCGFRAKFGRAP
jgi:hypothetical protein